MQTSSLSRASRILNVLSLLFALGGFWFVPWVIIVWFMPPRDHDFEPKADPTQSTVEAMLYFTMAMGPLALVCAFLGLSLMLACWFRDRQRPRIVDVVMLTISLAGAVVLLYYSAFATGFGGHTPTSNMFGWGMFIGAILWKVNLLFPVYCFVVSKISQPQDSK